MSVRWSTPEDITAKVQRRWSDGSLLRAYAEGKQFPAITLGLRGPKASEIGDELDAVRAWASRLDAGGRGSSRYDLEWTTVGGRYIGRNRLPARAIIGTFDQAWAILGVADEVARFDRVLALTGAVAPARAWVLARPHRAIELAGEWEQLLAAHHWLDAHRNSGRYLREISAPGVDTKFAEQHRSVLAGLLDVGATAAGFLTDLGLRSKPELVRMRVSAELGLPAELTEMAVRTDELRELRLSPAVALVLENEITYLSVDLPPGGVVIWGKGFEVDRVGRLPWLADVDVRYWGDIDTHGFAILDRLRAWLPQTRSVLMDRATLLEHRDRWVVETRPASSALTRLTVEESSVYDDLVRDALGHGVRLEQERIDWAWASSHLRAAVGFQTMRD